ncbi:hypothetical protein TPA0910_68770 [Streptomyces hygroscopicus subsp. sporocinereus]|uniref:Uncharacterized protein n=1 Tax=Streptomyces hygroscopicus TaxID=1912 RepID=A0ABQ3UA43_STRHY|nr:hypothetical protein TPA0910_68770 [Streptomyces hygroscopicus]
MEFRSGPGSGAFPKSGSGKSAAVSRGVPAPGYRGAHAFRTRIGRVAKTLTGRGGGPPKAFTAQRGPMARQRFTGRREKGSRAFSPNACPTHVRTLFRARR